MLKNLYLICGKSGSGKTTLVNTLSNDFGYKVLRSYTTRKPRHQSDTDHIYSSVSDYMNAKEKCRIIASTVFNHSYYWATLQQLEDSDLYVIDKIGIETLKAQYNGNRKIVVIYLDVDSGTRIQRMKLRGDKDFMIWERIMHDNEAFEGIEEISDFIVGGNRKENDVLQTVSEIISKCEMVNTI